MLDTSELLNCFIRALTQYNRAVISHGFRTGPIYKLAWLRALETNPILTMCSLLLQVPILPGHVISVSHGVSAESAAEDYEFVIRQLVRNRTVGVSRSSDCPKFDLILLVLGSDGRVASLFPGHPVLSEQTQWVVHVSGAPMDRITITLPVINSAANVAIMATGRHVAHPLAAALATHHLQHGSIPAQLVAPSDGELIWFTDTLAASLIYQDGKSASELLDSLVQVQ